MKTQNERTYDILKKGWHDMVYFINLHPAITRLGARVWDLRGMGVKVESRRVKGKHWNEYRIK